MSIFTKQFPNLKQLQKNITQELLKYENSTARSLSKAELKRQEHITTT